MDDLIFGGLLKNESVEMLRLCLEPARNYAKDMAIARRQPNHIVPLIAVLPIGTREEPDCVTLCDNDPFSTGSNKT